MKKGLIPVALGTVVTATGLAIDNNQSRGNTCRRNDYTSLVGTFLVGLGVAHILLGSIDIARD
ncbi:MAG: asparagine synthase [Anaeroplasmataceae bacterium]